MSDTPRTDEAWDRCFVTVSRDNAGFRDFTRKLERELNAAKAEIERLERIAFPIIE